MKKTLSMIIAVMLSLTSITGLTGCKENKQNGKDEVTLKWVMLGAKQTDADMVLEKFNEELQNYLPGTKIEIEFIDGSNYQEKWNLKMASNETVDIAWSGYAVDFMTQVTQGSYRKLNDLINEYGQDLVKESPEWLLDLGSINGEIYCIPNYQMMAKWPQGIKLLKEYSDAYLDKEALDAAYEEWKTNPEAGKKVYEIWGNCFEQIKQAGNIGNGIDVSSVGNFCARRTDVTTVKGFGVLTDTMEVYLVPELPEQKLWYDTAADWYKKGYIRSDILSVDGLGNEPYKNGYIAWQHNWCDRTAEMESKEVGVELDAVPMGRTYEIKNSIPSTSTVIPRTAKNPERAMQLINLLHTEKGKDLLNLLVWGIEGVHYTKTSDKRIETKYNTTQASSDDDYGLWNWAVASIKHSYEPQAQVEGWADYVYNLDITAYTSPLLGFKPDTKNIATEIAQISAVMGEYDKTLKFGAADDHEKLYKEYIEKLYKAGAQKVKDELQKQLDEWLKTK